MMNFEKKNLLDFIKQTFPVSDQNAASIAEHFQAVDYSKNQYFLKEGRVNSDYFFLEEGFMRAFTLDSNGDEVTTWFYSKNQVVFEVASYFKRIPSSENIQALTDCTGWVSHFDDLQALFHSMPEFREFGRRILVNGFVALKERTLNMIKLKAEERYELLLQTNPEIFQQVPLKLIASYLGITDTSLSRIRKEFSKK
jgi:CRP-like cAMP-binding protein